MKKSVLLILLFVMLCGCGNTKVSDIDGFSKADYKKYNSYASENGLDGDQIYIEGTLLNCIAYDEETWVITVEEEDGNRWICQFPDNPGEEKWSEIESYINEKCMVCGTYVGFSDVMKVPGIGIYSTDINMKARLDVVIDNEYETVWSWHESVSQHFSPEDVELENSEINLGETQTIEDDNEVNNFQYAVEAIGMKYSDVKNIDELDDWASGKRYSFVYDGFRYIVYELDNGEIDSIQTEYKRTPIFARGYEPLNYKDFEPDANVLSSIQSDALMKMTNYINGATSLDIKKGSMMYARIYDYYSIAGEVKAKNKTNKETYTFTADYMVKDNCYECVYLAIDGNIAFGTEDLTPEVSKTEIVESEVETSSEIIVLSEGKVGLYGQYDNFDGEEYIRYYVPAGNYTVKCNVGGGFYIETIEVHKEDGWDVATTIKQVDINPGEEIEIEIKEGQCITLYVNTEIELHNV